MQVFQEEKVWATSSMLVVADWMGLSRSQMVMEAITALDIVRWWRGSVGKKW